MKHSLGISFAGTFDIASNAPIPEDCAPKFDGCSSVRFVQSRPTGGYDAVSIRERPAEVLKGETTHGRAREWYWYSQIFIWCLQTLDGWYTWSRLGLA